jgi:hypothetical protein
MTINEARFGWSDPTPAHVFTPICPVPHTDQAQPDPMRSRADYGSDVDWRHHLEQELNDCELRLAGCTTTATTTHLDPAVGGDHRRATLEVCLDASRHCHGTIDAPRSAGGGDHNPAHTARIPRKLSRTQLDA